MTDCYFKQAKLDCTHRNTGKLSNIYPPAGSDMRLVFSSLSVFLSIMQLFLCFKLTENPLCGWEERKLQRKDEGQSRAEGERWCRDEDRKGH